MKDRFIETSFSGYTATIPSTPVQSAWTYTDIDAGCFLINTPDGKMYFRGGESGETIYFISPNGGINDYTMFEKDGTLVCVGSAKTWEDLRVEPTVRGTGVNNPSFEQYLNNGTSRGVYLYSFDDAVTNSQKEVYFTMQLPHAWASTEVSIHVHWIGNNPDTTAAPIWGLEYSWSDIGEIFTATTTVYTDGKNYTGTGNDTDIVAMKHYISEFTDIMPSATQNGISSILIGRLFRFSGDASDTYNVSGNKCGLLYIDAHYEVNTLGSREEYIK